MTYHDLLGEQGKDVVLEGFQIQEFCDLLESVGQSSGAPLGKLRKARKIVGRQGADTAGAFGHCCGRVWSAE